MTTTENPTALPAGRELDALVAERVMGWTDFDPAVIQSIKGVTWTGIGWQPHGSRGRPYPQYSTSIADAWQAVERMTDPKGPYAANGVGVGIDWTNGHCECCFTFTLPTGCGAIRSLERVEATESTVPVAICLAALRAVEAMAAREGV